MAEETTNKPFTDLGKYNIESRLMVACYICDENGVEIDDYREYKEKGKSLKIITEEYDQEVAYKGKRRYSGPEVGELIYWMYNKDQKNKENLSEFLESRSNIDDITDDMQRYATESDLVVLSDEINTITINPNIINVTNNGKFRRTIYKPSLSIPQEPPLNPEEPIPDPIIVPDESSPDTFTHIHIIDGYSENNKFEDSPFAEIDSPDNCRKLGNTSELYSKRCPSIRFNADPNGGLNKAILQLLQDPRLDEYNLETLIIDNNVTPELQKFKPLSAYSIKENTYVEIFKKFNKIEINNSIISVIFPKGECKANNITLKNCKILANNSTIKISESLVIENCTFLNNNPDSGTKHIIFNCSKDPKISGIILDEVVKLSFICEEDDINISLNSITFNCDSSNSSLKGPIVNLIKFTEATVSGIIKTEECVLSNSQLISCTDCIDVKLNDIELGKESINKTLFSINGFNLFKIDNISGELSDNISSLCTLTNSGTECDITFSEIKVPFTKLCSIVKCNINKFVITDSDFSLEELFSLLNSSIITFKIDNSTLSLIENIEIKLDTIVIDNSTINGKDITFTSRNSINLSKTTISCKNLNINLKEAVKLSTTEITFNVNKIFKLIGDNTETSASRIDFIKTNIEGSEFNIESVESVSFKYIFMMSKNLIINNCKKFSSTDTTIRLNSVNKMSFLKINEVKQTTFLFENGGNINIDSEKCIGEFNFNINSDSNIKRNCKNCKILEVYKNTDNNTLSVSLESNECKSSAFILDKKNLIISPLCKDFKLFKNVPENFEKNTAGKDKYENIYFGEVISE